MKKLVLLGAVAIVALSSCKKEYECCTSTTVVGTTTEVCITEKYSSSEVDDIEAASTEFVKIVCTEQ